MNKQLVEGLVIGSVVGHMYANSKKPTEVELIQQSIFADDLARMSPQEKRQYLRAAQQRQASSDNSNAIVVGIVALIFLTIVFWYIMIPLMLLALVIYIIYKICKAANTVIASVTNIPAVQTFGNYVYVIFVTIGGGFFLSCIPTIFFIAITEPKSDIAHVIMFAIMGFTWLLFSSLILRSLLTKKMGMKFIPISYLIGKFFGFLVTLTMKTFKSKNC